MATKRLKKAAATFAVQTRDECSLAVRALGDATREAARLQLEMNDRIAAVTAEYQAQIDPHKERANALLDGIQTWCEANRAELCKGGGKSANLITGEVAWRQRPPSVAVRGADTVIETLERLGLKRFLREKLEINKEAILNEPDAVIGIAGLNVVTGVEDFAVTPFEQEA